MTQRKRVRKPRSTWDFYLHPLGSIIIWPDSPRSLPMSLDYAKRLHKWLGKAIEYREQRLNQGHNK